MKKSYTRFTGMKKPRIESEQLNAIFQKWAENNGRKASGHWVDHFDRVNLRYGSGQQFDHYVWSCGGRIGTEYSKRYAEFFEDANLTIFVLRHLC
jgi:hypothetical protein